MDYWQSLLERFLKNECTERENKLVFLVLRDDWIDDNFLQAIESVMNDAATIEYIDKQSPVCDAVLENIREEIRNDYPKKLSKRKHFRIPEWMKIAALVIFIFISFGWLYFHFETGKEKLDIPVVMNTLTVPAGQTANLKLSDGTDIWLNSGTTLRYPVAFSDKKREVYLEGEAFFDVTQNKEQPFVVHTENHDVQVSGTQFNIEAYNRDNFVTALLSGSVTVNSIDNPENALTLQPNTMAYLQGGKLVSENITDFSRFHWKEGLISIRDMSFVDLMAQFEKCYGIKIIVENKNVINHVYTGRFRRSDGIDYALRILQRDVRFTFKRDEENQIIIIK
jgi:ferric-dicitrate binding protein FerR (iron transport regulator)